MKALDLFCGAGGASVGLHGAGYAVTGMDINPQPNYPFTFIQADVMSLAGIAGPGLKTYRHRLFECNFTVWPLEHNPHTHKVAKMGRKPKEGEFMHVVGNFSGANQAREAMSISWMTRDELREAIPPQYATYIAECARDARNSLPRKQGG